MVAHDGNAVLQKHLFESYMGMHACLPPHVLGGIGRYIYACPGRQNVDSHNSSTIVLLQSFVTIASDRELVLVWERPGQQSLEKLYSARRKESWGNLFFAANFIGPKYPGYR